MVIHPLRLAIRALGAAALTALIATSLPNTMTGARAASPAATAPAIDTTNVDPTCKPCDDFYQFATGGWSKRTALPTGRARARHRVGQRRGDQGREGGRAQRADRETKRMHHHI